MISSNSSGEDGGGSWGGTIQSCTISGNHAVDDGGGTIGGRVENCIVYFNSAAEGAANCSSGTVDYTCTSPDPGGIGNITNAPGIVGVAAPHITETSPCIDAGGNQGWMAAARDIDGESRIGNGTVDMGCDEFYSGGQTGLISIAAAADYLNVVTGFPIEFAGDIQGRVTGFRWRRGDGSIDSNSFLSSHAFSSADEYDVVLEAWNLSGTVAATLTVQVVTGSTKFVSQTGSHVAPFDTWAKAATNIQAAVSAQTVAGGNVMVNDGVYDTGGDVVHGSLVNRIAITNAISVRSVNGPESTIVVGQGPSGASAVRCAYIGEGASLEGFTLTGGHTRGDYTSDPIDLSGGGARCAGSATISNCIITGNSAFDSGGGVYKGTVQDCTISGNSTTNSGGGTSYCTVQNCVISENSTGSSGGGTSYCTVQNCVINENSAGFDGGGTYYGMVQNCVISENSAQYFGGGTYYGAVKNCTITGNRVMGVYPFFGADGGGTYGGTVHNCIVYYNTSVEGAANCGFGTVEYTCTTPDPGGTGIVTDAPQFMDAESMNFHLQSTSPCVDAGTNEAWMVGAVDLGGNLRIQSGIVDMGCYEYTQDSPDTDDDGINDQWELRYFLSLTIASFHSDWDQDGFCDGFEFHAGTIPTDASSYLGITSVTMNKPEGEAVIRWSSVRNTWYSLYCTSNLIHGMNVLLAEQIPATPPENVYTDTVAGVDWQFYGVELEIQPCNYTIDPASVSFGALGGNHSISVSAGSRCSWTATKNVNWLTITSGANGTGVGTIRYSVSENSNYSRRKGLITVGGQIHEVSQSGASGDFDVLYFLFEAGGPRMVLASFEPNGTFEDSLGNTGLWFFQLSEDRLIFVNLGAARNALFFGSENTNGLLIGLKMSFPELELFRWFGVVINGALPKGP
jgi:hypothetical protein